MIDMWYGNEASEVDRIDITFSDVDCLYRGNCYRNGKAIGDYWCSDSMEIYKLFPHLNFSWI